MNFNCPYCGKESNFMDIQISKDLEFVIKALPSFGTRYSHLVMGYAQLFGVTPFHLKAKKLRLIIEEMKKLFDAQSFTWQKKTYAISHAGIAEALDIVIKKNFETSLDSHNYLRRVMVTIAERESKEKSVRGEKDLRNSESNATARGMHREEAPERITTEQAQKNLEKVRDILGGFAK